MKVRNEIREISSPHSGVAQNSLKKFDLNWTKCELEEKNRRNGTNGGLQ